MDLQKVFDAAVRNPEMHATFSFKLEQDLKDSFIDLCTEKGLSTGAVMRELLRQFMGRVDE